MSDSKEDKTDQASIKPVSSLRSLFEKQASSDTQIKPPPSPLPLRSFPRPDTAQSSSQIPTRASLDIPRIDSPWSSTDDTPNQKGSKAPPVPRPRRPKSTVLHRPLSTTSLSTPRSPPFLAVDAPTSPPKTSQPSASSPLTPIRLYSRTPHLSTPTAENPNSEPAIEPQSSPAGLRPVALGERPIHGLVNQTKSQSSIRSGPPPVNRADKPKVPSKPSAMAGRPSLEPAISAPSDRVSPFSTPPSSDESLDLDVSRPAKSGKAKSVAETKVPGEVHAHESGKSGSKQLAEGYGDKIADPVGQRRDARTFGFSRATDKPDPVAEIPPGLPPRRNHMQQVARTQDMEDTNQRQRGLANRQFAERSKEARITSVSKPEFLPPPKRTSLPVSPNAPRRQDDSFPDMVNYPSEPTLPPRSNLEMDQEPDASSSSSLAADFPDASNASRRPPVIKYGAIEIDTNHDSRLVDVCGQHVVATGHATRVWNVSSGQPIASINQGEREIRVTALAFKPALTTAEEGSDLWLGTNYGDLQEVNITSQSVVSVRAGAHERREVVKIHRYQNSMWTLDDGGKLSVWQGEQVGLPDFHCDPILHRVPKGHTFSLAIEGNLWLATAKDIWIFRPNPTDGQPFSILQEPLGQQSLGSITSGATIGSQLDRVYFGHADGKISIYSTRDFSCLEVVTVSNYKISCLVGVGLYLWAGSSTGMLSVYETHARPWVSKKIWLGHGNPVLNILVDRSSLWKDGSLRVLSLGADNALRFWDGTLQTDWLESDMRDRDVEYCTFRELTALVVTWNAGAATPTHLRHNERDFEFFSNILRADTSPDLLVFGFQELVDLEDKRLTAKTLFKGNKKKDSSEQEHMSRQYRAWRDYLVRCIEDNMPSNEPYHLLHTASMVGLFSCVFIKASQRNQVRNVNAVEIKRGMGGLHGNKGALILRFVLDDSSICLVNCHLAAGQTQTVNRNNDITAILESTMLPPNHHISTVSDTFVGGGDGSMILDHEICILNGDLNYRIDTMGRDTVIKAITSNNLPKLLERDQLLVSRRRNAGFRIRAFTECPITFPPTYKYDVGSDRYDTSEKRRAPAWCDRILYRGAGKIKQTHYQRHELRVSDHRPVSGRFRMRIKAINSAKRADVWKASEARFRQAKESLAKEAKIQYLRDVLGVPPHESKNLI
ncbi:hypothetical protein ACLMJK_001241 [Lecanora helva]